MKTRILAFALSKPLFVYALVLLCTAFFTAQLFRINIDTDPENMLPADQPERVFHNMVEARFNLHDAIVVGIVNKTHPQGIYNLASLSNLHRLSNEILQIEGVIAPDVMSLATADNITQGDQGELRFTWLLNQVPADQVAALKVRSYVERLPLIMNTLVSQDGRAAAIYVPIQSKDLSYPISLKIQALAEALDGNDEYHITGLPVAEDTFGVEMFRQMAISAPLAGLMIFALLLYFFRNVRLVLAPMIVAMVTVIVTMGALIGLGFSVHIMSSMIAIFLMPIAVVDSVHIMSEFADRYSAGDNPKECIQRVVSHLYKPMLFTSITTSIGFLSLLLTPIPPVQVFGFFVAFGVMLAFFVTVIFLPAYIVRMKPEHLASLARLKSGSSADTLLARVLRKVGHFAFNRGNSIIVLALVVLVVSVLGVLQIQINDNPVRWFKETHRIRIADQELNAHFAGTYDAFLVLDYDASSVLASYKSRAEALLKNAAFDAMDSRTLNKNIQADTEAVSVYFATIIAEIDELMFSLESVHPDLDALLTLTEQAQVDSKYFQSPQALQLIESLQLQLMYSGKVGKTNSLVDVVKVVNRELYGGDSQAYRIPPSAPAVAQTLLQFQSSHRPQDLWHMLTPDYTSSAIWLQLKSGDNQDLSQVMTHLDAYFAQHPLPPEVSAQWAGKTYINVIWQDAMVSGMLQSLLGAFFMVFIIMALLFRSLLFGLLAMLPLTLTIVAVYGLIGWIGKDYDMPIAVLSALTLGLSVDFAIHFIQRMRSQVRESGSFAQSAVLMFEEPARAISRNAIVIALGFTPLFFADLMPYITVGFFMASIMAISAFSTLMLIPALMSVGERWLFVKEGDSA